MVTKKLLELVPTLQAVSIVKENIKTAKRPTAKKLLKTGITNIVGANLIKVESDFISGI